MTHLADLPDVVLGPLMGRPDADWYKAPPGRWCPAQIVHHLTLGLSYSASTFESRRERPPMRRRRRSPWELIAYLFVLQVGWVPGRRRAPPQTMPAEHPDRDALDREFRDGVQRFLALERTLLPRRRSDLFVKHPRLGDLTLPEWGRFHVWHCTHHARQIRARLDQ